MLMKNTLNYLLPVSSLHMPTTGTFLLMDKLSNELRTTTPEGSAILHNGIAIKSHPAVRF